MRLNLLVAGGLIGLSLVAAAFVACSDSGTSCKPNTLTLQVELDGTANFADTVTVTSVDPGAMVMQSFPHTPNGGNFFDVDVVWPGGYPGGKTVNFQVRALGGATLLGENVATIHLGATCDNGLVAIRAETLDAAPSTD
jgi:hypothetical protein